LPDPPHFPYTTLFRSINQASSRVLLRKEKASSRKRKGLWFLYSPRRNLRGTASSTIPAVQAHFDGREKDPPLRLGKASAENLVQGARSRVRMRRCPVVHQHDPDAGVLVGNCLQIVRSRFCQ